MITYGQMIYYCLDAIKAFSDDSTVTEEHVMFMLDRYRASVLRKNFARGKAANGLSVGEGNYQTIPIDRLVLYRPDDLEANIYSDDGLDYIIDGSKTHFKSNYKYSRDVRIPDMIEGFSPKVYITDPFKSVATYVDNERFEYTGWNKYLGNFIYATVGGDRRLYLKSGNIERLSLVNGVNLRALFESPSEVNALVSPDEDPYDGIFPLEEALVPDVIAMVVRDSLGTLYRPYDKYNNADDDLANISAFIRQNMKQRYVNDTQNGDSAE